MTAYELLHRIGQKVDILQQLNYQKSDIKVILDKIAELEKEFGDCIKYLGDDDNKIIYNYTKANYGAVLIEIAKHYGDKVHNSLPYSKYKTGDEFLYDYEMQRLELYRNALTLYDNQSESQISNAWMDQVRVNLANVYNETGRIIESLDILESCKNNFGMARVNYAMKLYLLSSYILDKEIQKELLMEALFYYETTIDSYSARKESDPIPDDIYKSICATKRMISERLNLEYRDIDTVRDLSEDIDSSFGIQVNKYKQWCGEQRLILSVRNIYTGASVIDDIHLPNMGAGYFAHNQSLSYYSWYNILKQEYNQARYFLYQAHSLVYDDVHESQEDILLVNTLDYPEIGYRTELLKSSLKMAYGVLDKIGLLCNDFVCGKNMPAGDITFTKWFKGIECKIRINDKFTPLYWVAKDFFSCGSFNRLRLLRNVIEHRYLRVVRSTTIPLEKELSDRTKMEYTVTFSELKDQVFETLKLIRSLTFYIVFAFNESYLETVLDSRKNNKVFIPLTISYYDDEWKN